MKLYNARLNRTATENVHC